VSTPAPPALAVKPARRTPHSWRLLLAITTIAFACAEGAYQFGALSALDEVYSDYWHRIAGKRYEPAHVALVEVDEISLSKNEDPLAFWAPAHARALATLRQAGATVVGVDFLFSITPETWLQKYKLSNAEGLKNYDLPFRQELNAGKTVLVGAVSRGEPGQNDNFLLPHTEYLLSLPNTDITSHIGLADLVVDSDGTTRRYAMAPKLKLDAETAKGAPRLTLAALLAVHATKQRATDSAWQFAGRRRDANSINTISYAGPPGAIPRVSFHKLLETNAVQNPEIKALRGKVVIIGGNYEGMNDLHGTPYSNGKFARQKSFMTGPEIQANTVETLLSGRATEPAPDALRWIVAALVLIIAIAIVLRTTPLIGSSVTIAAALLALSVGYAAFHQYWLFPAATLQLGLFVAFCMALGLRLKRSEREKIRIRGMFEGYASEELVEMFLASGERLDLGGKSMNISILFSDIRNFTTITEKLSAHETVEFLNVYFSRVIDVIKAEGGRIDKFIGDAVMAEFAVPYPFPDHAARALRAAAGMRQVAEEFKGWMRARFPERGIPEFAIGIGIHSGSAVVGNIGSESRKEYTAIGDTVNVASRLEGETKTMECIIVASADTVRMAGGMAVTGRHETLKVKGRAEPVEVFEIVDIKP
jgi:adenylate cyclase